jgi:hypothetical protein
MNFYWLKLDLARLNLTDIPDVRYIYFTFLEPRKDQDLLNEICFTSFRHQFKFVQNLETLLEFETKLEIRKGHTATWAGYAWQPVRTGMPGPWPMRVGATYGPQSSGIQTLRPLTGALQGSAEPARGAAGRRRLLAARAQPSSQLLRRARGSVLWCNNRWGRTRKKLPTIGEDGGDCSLVAAPWRTVGHGRLRAAALSGAWRGGRRPCYSSGLWRELAWVTSTRSQETVGVTR